MPSGCQEDFHIEDFAVRYLDGDLAPKEFELLDGRLRQDSEARRAFIDLCLDATAIREIEDAALANILGATDKIEVNSKSDENQFGFDTPPSSWPDPPVVFGAISFASLLLVVSGLIAFLFLPSLKGPSTNLTDYVARVSSVSGDCRLADGGTPVRSGERLPKDAELRLASGGAHVTFRSGASVVLDGPCDFDVLGPNAGHLARGHLLGRIPGADASGFSISTPDAHVVDLGTEFCVHVTDGGPTAVEVFDGQVRLASRKDTALARLLDAGERVRLAPRRFIPEKPQGRPRFRDMLAAPHPLELAVLAENPLAYWRFEHAGDSPIAPDSSGHGHHGVKKNGAGVSPIDGIAGGALVVDGVDDYMEVPASPELGLEDTSWTVIGWINVGDTSRAHPLFGTAPAEDGAAPDAWTVSLNTEGCAEAGPHGSSEGKMVASDHDLRTGTWRQIAFVLDRRKQEQRIYIDGKPAAKSPLGTRSEDVEARRGGLLRVGMNPASGPAKGYIDEVALFNRALPDETIAALHKAAVGE